MTPAKRASQKSRRRPRRSTLEGPPPSYDAAAVGRVAKAVDILSVELLGAHFEREDERAIPTRAASEDVPTVGISVEWEINDDDGLLGCALTFGTVFDDKPPYNLVARFRLLYSVRAEETLRRKDLDQFAHWNAMFNAWPYWREYLSSTINRANLPRFIAPVMKVPAPGAATPL